MNCRATSFNKLYLVLLSFIWLWPAANADEHKTLKLAGAHWCPYSCDYAPFPGYVTQYISALLEKEGYTVSVDTMNWPTAVRKAEAGEYDGLITAVPQEVPNLLLTTTPTDIYHSCFYVLTDSRWYFHDIDSLQGQTLGVIDAYAYGSPLDEWLQEEKNQNQIQRSDGELPIKELIKQLQSQTITTFIQDRYVLSHFLHRSNKELPMIKEAGCLSESPFFLALNPKLPQAEEVINYLNKHIASEKNQQLKHYFKLRYGLGKYF